MDVNPCLVKSQRSVSEGSSSNTKRTSQRPLKRCSKKEEVESRSRMKRRGERRKMVEELSGISVDESTHGLHSSSSSAFLEAKSI